MTVVERGTQMLHFDQQIAAVVAVAVVGVVARYHHVGADVVLRVPSYF